MENLKVDSKKIISILGLPRQGTTLISGIFNTPRNSFSAVEPHWSKICGREISSGNKIPHDVLFGQHPSQVIPRLKQFLHGSDTLEVCTIKETYRITEKECCNYLLESNSVDIYLFIFRNPIYGFNGWKKARWDDWYNQSQNYIACYEHLYNDSLKLENEGKKVCRISYEEICKPTAALHLNSRLSQFGVEFTSEVRRIEPTGTIFGDPRASSGGAIGESSNSHELLNTWEIDSLKPLEEKIYSKI
jgi:hypothetical protein